MRLFFAFEVPAEQRSLLAGLLPDDSAGVRRVPAERMHVTLRFVGSVPEGVRNELAAGLPELSFQAALGRIEGVGTFPPLGRPRVLWAGLRVDEALIDTQRSLEALCTAVGIEPEERAWAPHVTLARIRGARPRWLPDFLETHSELTLEPFRIDRIILFDSVPDGHSVRYEPVATAQSARDEGRIFGAH